MNKDQLGWLLRGAIVFGFFSGIPAWLVVRDPQIETWIRVMFFIAGCVFWIVLIWGYQKYKALPGLADEYISPDNKLVNSRIEIPPGIGRF